MDSSPSTVLHTFNGYHAGDLFGWRVAAGDVNGDGRADVVVSALGFDASRRLGNVGRITIYDGVSGSTIRQLGGEVRLHLFRGDLSVGNEDQFGRTIALADLNGDGKAEVIAGAHVGDGGGLGDAGWIRVFDGGTGAVLFQFDGTAGEDHFGVRVAVGDVNGDLQPDVIVGAEWGTLPGTPPGAGYVRVHDGATGAVLAEVNGSCDFNDQYNGDHLGFALAVHDVNGDGTVNILAGAPDGDSSGWLDNGYVRLYQDF